MSFAILADYKYSRERDVHSDLEEEDGIRGISESSDIEPQSDDLFVDLDISATDTISNNYAKDSLMKQVQDRIERTSSSSGELESSKSTASEEEDVSKGGSEVDSSEESDGEASNVSHKKETFFEEGDTDVHDTFAEYKLSRPILRAIVKLNFERPTPVQARMIKSALKGMDLCVSAVTGSGKTAAFAIPILERLMYRDTSMSVSRVLVIVPTRELGVQCCKTIRSLSCFTTIQTALCIGGVDIKAQDIQLSQRPDIIVATPGRLIDHVTNSVHFSLDTIEILVIDEADRILETGFLDELKEIVTKLPKNRQTMLLSATMTDKVEDLAVLSLKNPVRLFVDTSEALPKGLTQEFIRIRDNKLNSKPSILLSLCATVLKSSTLVFFNEKRAAHRMKILFDLCGYSAAELHGNLTQKQRMEALESFKQKKIVLLFCTDVAARGLDIPSVKSVINYDMPKKYSQYVHRVGRTARAGSSGRSISLVSEADRKIVKRAIENSTSKVKHRILDPDQIERFGKVAESHNERVEQILEEERSQKDRDKLEMETRKVENIIKHRKEIMSRPKKTWFKKVSKSVKFPKSDTAPEAKKKRTSMVGNPKMKSRKRTRS